MSCLVSGLAGKRDVIETFKKYYKIARSLIMQQEMQLQVGEPPAAPTDGRWLFSHRETAGPTSEISIWKIFLPLKDVVLEVGASEST